ncbi:MAG TPA: pitrilysin family protein [Dongiaceae bacterium]|nr:pitrilysin family protein [Dongiaceae bacterium]
MSKPSVSPVIRRMPHCVGVLLLAGWLTPALRAQEVPVIEKTLPNGMRLLLVERHDEPTIAGGWVAHVGSANECPGHTGIAHLFEHMMFKGTKTIGTKDYAKDLEIINEQEQVREQMRAEDVKLRAAWRRGEIDDWQKPENKTARWKELNEQFQKLVAEQRAIMVKNEFWGIYQKAGASGMNAFTTDDLTAYFCNVPANKLELWMWMESDRLLNSVRREFYSERDVVFEERRMRTDSPPLGLMNEAFNAMFWESLPYSWPTVGWPSDIPNISKVQADEFFATYYAPQNVTAVLVGDFQPEQAEALAEKYLGRIPRGTNAVPDVVTTEMKQPAEKRMYGEADANPQVDIMWHTVPFGHKDSYALQILGELLSNRTGRLYKGLVLGSGVATDVGAGQNSQKWAGSFEVGGEAAEGHTPEEVEQGVYAELAKFQTNDVPAEELQKVKNNFAAGEYRKLQTNMGILTDLLMDDGEGDWHEFNNAITKIMAVTPADIRRVANEYFTRDNRAVAIYTRKPAAAPGKEVAK